MDACAMDMREIGELKPQVYPSLEHGHSKHLVKAWTFSREKVETCMHAFRAPQHTHTHSHTFSYNFKELMESMNPGRETPNERKSHYFVH